MFFPALTIIVGVLIVIALYVIERTQRFKAPENSVIEGPIDLERLRDIMAAHDVFEAYVIDTNGLPVAFAHGGDRADVVEKAEWLASILQVPLENHLD